MSKAEILSFFRLTKAEKAELCKKFGLIFSIRIEFT